MNAGKTKYTAVDGIAELKSAIVNKFARENNITCTATWSPLVQVVNRFYIMA